jgi:hypothetical protein
VGVAFCRTKNFTQSSLQCCISKLAPTNGAHCPFCVKGNVSACVPAWCDSEASNCHLTYGLKPRVPSCLLLDVLAAVGHSLRQHALPYPDQHHNTPECSNTDTHAQTAKLTTHTHTYSLYGTKSVLMQASSLVRQSLISGGTMPNTAVTANCQQLIQQEVQCESRLPCMPCTLLCALPAPAVRFGQLLAFVPGPQRLHQPR